MFAPMPQHPSPPGPPPTIADLKAMGVTGALVTCGKCQNSRSIEWGQIGAADEAPFPALAARRFRCSACGAAESSVMPDWRGYRAAGRGTR